jgi:hypothetical protein
VSLVRAQKRPAFNWRKHAKALFEQADADANSIRGVIGHCKAKAALSIAASIEDWQRRRGR